MDDPNWLWEALAANWWSALFVLGVGVGLAILQLRASRWVQPALIGLAGSALGAFGLYSYVSLVSIPTRSPDVSPRTIEARIKNWAEGFGMGIRRESPGDDAYFAYSITSDDGRTFEVFRPKDRAGYLEFQARLSVSPNHSAILESLSEAESDRISTLLTIEMARSNIGFALVGPPPMSIVLNKATPITGELTEGSFAHSLDELSSALVLARETFVLELDRSPRAVRNVIDVEESPRRRTAAARR